MAAWYWKDMQAVSAKFSLDFVWNSMSFIVMAVVGLLLNFIIANAYDTAIVGVFNQVFALYSLFSQLAAFGVHLSVLKSISQHAADKRLSSEILASGIALTTVTSIIACIIIIYCKDLASTLLNSPAVGVGILYSAPGLVLFAINKSILAYFNGTQHLRTYAVFQTVRYLAILLALVVFVLIRVDGFILPAIFAIAEVLLFCLLLIYLVFVSHVKLSLISVQWLRRHFTFGMKAAFGNVLLDMNAHINILVLGFFSSDYIVGIFSFAARFAEGYSQFPVVVRTIINPLITQTNYDGAPGALEKLIATYKRVTYKFLVPFGLLLTCGYPIMSLFLHNGQIMGSWAPFAIMMCGLLISVGYLPFSMVFNQTGHPGHQTLYLAYFFLTNLALNIIMVPLLGVYGAALATGLPFVFQIFIMRRMVFSLLKVQM